MDLFQLYELCAQSPRSLGRFLLRAHGASPTILAEDFCSSAALSRWWVENVPGGSALAADIDPAVLWRARELAGGAAARIALTRVDLLAEATKPALEAADVAFCGNFSIGYALRRADLLRYLARTRARLRRGGIFVCDTYGGATAFKLGTLERTFVAPDGAVVRYAWSHDAADPLSGIVENSISFRIEIGGEVVGEHPRAFTYRWRLWSIAELREAFAEAGFRSSDVHAAIDAEGDSAPVTSPSDLGDDWAVIIVGRAE